jgi:hypothetical protein
VVAGHEQSVEDLLFGLERALPLEELPESLFGPFGPEKLDGRASQFLGLTPITGDGEKAWSIFSFTSSEVSR